MTDREMLELAAKAAGIEHLGCEYCVSGSELWDIDGKKWWRPLANDGDALRLAVKLGIETEFYEHGEVVYAGVRFEIKYVYRATDCGDIYAATRLAIVRAAAQIGAQM